MDNAKTKQWSDWRLIWLPNTIDKQQARIEAAKIACAAGLVEVKDRLAIRVRTSDFDAAWKSINPGQSPPAAIDISKTYKVESLPFGASLETMQAWLASLNWEARPLRAVGPRSWILGSGQTPPEGPTSFNGQLVLVREIKSHAGTYANPILAGPRPRLPSRSHPQQDGNNANPPDPWARYIGPRSQPDPPLPSRAATGPIDARLSAQDDKLKQFEDAMQEIKQVQAEQTAILTQVKETQTNTEQATKKYLDNRLQEFRTELDQNVTAAWQNHAKHFDASLGGFKQLLLAQNKRKTPGPGAEDMEP